MPMLNAPWVLPYSSRVIAVDSQFHRAQRGGRRGPVTSVDVSLRFVWRETEFSREFVCSPEDWQSKVCPLHDQVGCRAH